jgi:hypothetical protein
MKYIGQVLTHGVSSEPVFQQPVTEPVQALTQRAASQLLERPWTLKYQFQRHNNLLSFPCPSRQSEIVMARNYVQQKSVKVRTNGENGREFRSAAS